MLFTCSVLIWIIAAVRWGDWRNYKNYLSTIWYLIALNAVCNYLYYGYSLWEYGADVIFPNHVIKDAVSMFVIFPCTVLVFLGNYPKRLMSSIFYTLAFAVVYIIPEWIAVSMHGMTYKHGWSIWWSLVIDLLLFSFLYIHYKMPLLAYIFSVMLVALFLLRFPIPLATMK